MAAFVTLGMVDAAAGLLVMVLPLTPHPLLALPIVVVVIVLLLLFFYLLPYLIYCSLLLFLLLERAFLVS